MRISDWSSDVCSSDLDHADHVLVQRKRFAVMAGLQLGQCRYHHLAHREQAVGVVGAEHEAADACRQGGILEDRKSVVSGKSVSVRLDLGGRRTIKHKNDKDKNKLQLANIRQNK